MIHTVSSTNCNLYAVLIEYANKSGNKNINDIFAKTGTKF